MARNRKTAKGEGARFESAVEMYMQWAFDDLRIVRRRTKGRDDPGDIGNLYWNGNPVAIECKNTREKAYRAQWAEAVDEMHNIGGEIAVLVKKRPGVGYRSLKSIGRQSSITSRDMLSLLRQGLNAPMPLTLEDVPRNPDLVGMTLEQFCLLVNHGLPLGPESRPDDGED